MNNLELITTEIGKIPVIVNENNGIFIGKLLYEDINIHIESPTKESCLIGLKNAFEIHMSFWLNQQLPINIFSENNE